MKTTWNAQIRPEEGKRLPFGKILSGILAFFFACTILPAQEAAGNAQEGSGEEPVVCTLDSYLQLEGLVFGLPCFREDADINQKPFTTATLLDYPFFEEELQASFRPFSGQAFSWMGQPKTWQEVPAGHVSRVDLPDTSWNAWALSCFYAKVPHYVEATLEISFAPACQLYLDGVKVFSQGKEADSMQPQARKTVLKLEPGYHVFLLKSLYTPRTPQGGRLDLRLQASGTEVELGADLKEPYGLAHYLDAPVVFSPQLSAKGDYFKLSFNVSDPIAKKVKTVHRIYRVADLDDSQPAEAVMELQGVSGLSFAGKASFYAYMKRDGKYREIHAGEIGSPARRVYRTEKDLSGFAWDPAGRFLILQTLESAQPSKNGLKRIYDPQDQWPYYRTRCALSKLDLGTGSQVPLTYGYKSAEFLDLSQDGRFLLFATSESADTLRQYLLMKVYCMDLETFSVRELFSTTFSCTASFSPDAGKLLVLGSEQIFEDSSRPGVSKPCPDSDCFIANDYDRDAFLFDMASGQAENITQGFGPSLQTGVWTADGSYIYFYADDHDFVNIYAYRLADKSWHRVPARVDVVNGLDASGNGLLYTGSSIDRPYQAYYLVGDVSKPAFYSAKALRNTVLAADPQGKEVEKLDMASHRDWTYRTAGGDTIEAVFYLPPDFDSSRRYPCIVYYYGGTTPTPRALSVRYPKAVWASQGYVVLVLQPSGAIGYSREFSARHVNDWGKTVADEIITGVRRFCLEHAFVDSSRIGCIGASYGGFMTQLLVTRTDLFAAAVSHAGISSISSYWGEGYWGYLYGSTANAFSFPWNRKDLFVDQSPLFNADKVHTPLLLLHGTSDVNVPIGESYQMFKALRLLGRDVAMVTVAGEDHGIVDYAKRWDWEKTILAWFEKYLKGEPLWWETLYPERKL